MTYNSRARSQHLGSEVHQLFWAIGISQLCRGRDLGDRINEISLLCVGCYFWTCYNQEIQVIVEGYAIAGEIVSGQHFFVKSAGR